MRAVILTHATTQYHTPTAHTLTRSVVLAFILYSLRYEKTKHLQRIMTR